MSGGLDVDAALLRLLGDLQPGDEVAPGLRFLDLRTECGPRLTLASASGEFDVEIARLLPGRRSAAQTRAFALSYRAGDAPTSARKAEGLAACRVLAARVARHEEEVLALLRDADAPRVREVRVARLLERADAGRWYTVTPYVGCLIGCRFCYAQSHVAETRALLGLPPAPWGSYVDVRVNAPEVLAQELAALPPAPIKFCAVVSDPYHAVERRYGLTRRMLEVLRASEAGVLILTRSALIERDLDVLAAVPKMWAGVSLPTLDDEVRRRFEPRASSVSERLGALRACRAAGVSTFAIVQPILPGPLDALADTLAGLATSVRVEVLHGVEGAADDFAGPEWAQAADPAWQHDRAEELRAALSARGVPLWSGELPPELA